jgi:hypothetical protein
VSRIRSETMNSAWVRTASSVRVFASGPRSKIRTLEAVRTQALSQEGCETRPEKECKVYF